MITPIETTKEMLADLNLTDKELEEVRDVCDMLAEVVVDDWFERRGNEIKNEKQRKKQNNT